MGSKIHAPYTSAHHHIPGDVSLLSGGHVHRLGRRRFQINAARFQRDIHFQQRSAIVVDDGAHLRRIARVEETGSLHFDKERLGADQVAGHLPDECIRRHAAHIHHPGGQVFGQRHFHLRLTVFIGHHLRGIEGRIFKVLTHRNNAQVAFTLAAATARALPICNAFLEIRVVIFGIQHNTDRSCYGQPLL